jgi:hypothetical protein
MYKLLFIFLSLIHLNGSDIINFQEEKYIDIIGESFLKKGTLEFDNKKIKLQYKGSDKVLIYKEDTLILKESNEIKSIDLKEKEHLKMIFLLIEAIYKDDMEILKEFFILSKEDTRNILKPTGTLKNYINYVAFKKNKTLEFIIIDMKNQNKTTIRQIDD